MILNCPSCSAKFKVDEALLGEEGRAVRCGSCGHGWHQAPQPEEPPEVSSDELELELDDEPEIESVPTETADPEIEIAMEPDPDPEPEPTPEPIAQLRAEPERPSAVALDKLDEQRARVQARRSNVAVKTKRFSNAIGWATLLVFVAGLAALIVGGRKEIIAYAPGTIQFYEMVGLEEVIGQGLDLRDVLSERRLVDGERTLVVEGTIVNVSGAPRDVPELKASLTDVDGAELAYWIFAADSSSLPPGGFTTFQTSAVDPPADGSLSLVFISRQE